MPSWLVGDTVLRYYSGKGNLNVYRLFAVLRIKYIETGKCFLARNVPCWEEICVPFRLMVITQSWFSLSAIHWMLNVNVSFPKNYSFIKHHQSGTLFPCSFARPGFIRKVG